MPLAFFDRKRYGTFQMRRHTAAEMPTLKDGEIAWAVDTKQLYIGHQDGENTIIDPEAAGDIDGGVW